MARLYAQFGAVVFLVFGVGGLLTGDAGTLVHHLPQGNVGPSLCISPTCATSSTW